MPGTKSKIRRSIQVEERRAKVAELYLQGKTEREIAAIVSVGPSQVHRDIQGCRSEWRTRATEAVEVVNAELLAHHRRNYCKLLADYQASKAPKITTRREYEIDELIGENPNSAKPEARKRTVNIIETISPSTPNVALIDAAAACLDKIARLTGSYKPTKIDNAKSDGREMPPTAQMLNVTYLDFSKIDPDSLSAEVKDFLWQTMQNPELLVTAQVLEGQAAPSPQSPTDGR